MKLPHAAALALVGWYLMLPPVHNGTADLSVPLSKWEIAFVFDSATDCDHSHQAQVVNAAIFLKKKMPSEAEHDAAVKFLDGQCVASDDSRLKP